MTTPAGVPTPLPLSTSGRTTSGETPDITLPTPSPLASLNTASVSHHSNDRATGQPPDNRQVTGSGPGSLNVAPDYVQSTVALPSKPFSFGVGTTPPRPRSGITSATITNRGKTPIAILNSCSMASGNFLSHHSCDASQYSSSQGGLIYGGMANGSSNSGPTTKKRQKRLERNRESARVSRRRRKHYLEELEVKVKSMSDEMDQGRFDHAAAAVRTVRSMRSMRLREIERILEHNKGVSCARKHETGNSGPYTPRLPEQYARVLDLQPGRTSDELRVVQTFQRQQLTSLVQPATTKFVLWLTLQNDKYFRGGRAASERLSAARIGERMLHSGTDRAKPSESMWPLVCNEVGLSHDQEDKIRNCQRAILANIDSWVQRHTAVSTKNVIESLHSTLGGVHEAGKQRERALISILTIEQRATFLAWAARRADTIRNSARAKIGPPIEDTGEQTTSPSRHVAANMYILNHRLSKIRQRLPPTQSLVDSTKLKKLSRRPSFESLAGQQETESGTKLTRDSSFPSTGSLKRSLQEVTCDDSTESVHSPVNQGVTPESAEAASAPAVAATLGDVLAIIPIPPRLSSQRSPSQDLKHPCTNSNLAQLQQLPVSHRAALFRPSQVAPSPETIDEIPMPTPVSVLLQTSDDFITPYGFNATGQHCSSSYCTVSDPTKLEAVTSSGRTYQSAPQLSGHPSHTYRSRLPAPMIMIPVPEELFPFDDLPIGADDWAIGEGFDMDAC